MRRRPAFACIIQSNSNSSSHRRKHNCHLYLGICIIVIIIVSHDSHVSNSPTESHQTRPLLYHQRADGATCPASGAAVDATHCEIHEREPKQERHKNESKCPKGIGTNRRPGPKRHGRPRHHRKRPRRRRLGRTENDVRDAQLGRLSNLPAE